MPLPRAGRRGTGVTARRGRPSEAAVERSPRSAAAPAVVRSLLVPLYVHPDVDPDAWQALEGAAGRLYGVVLNVADGPGSGGPDSAFTAAAERLRTAGVRLFGYVDTGYGTRPVQDAARDVRRHREWYGAAGVFLDRAAAGRDRLPYYRRLADAARRDGARTVVLNPGVHPDPAYTAVGDLLVTYEGTWTDYAAAAVPGWTAAHPPARFCHLVYGVPGGVAARAVARTAVLRGAGVHCAVPGHPPNPWRHVPPAAA